MHRPVRALENRRSARKRQSKRPRIRPSRDHHHLSRDPVRLHILLKRIHHRAQTSERQHIHRVRRARRRRRRSRLVVVPRRRLLARQRVRVHVFVRALDPSSHRDFRSRPRRFLFLARLRRRRRRRRLRPRRAPRASSAPPSFPRVVASRALDRASRSRARRSRRHRARPRADAFARVATCGASRAVGDGASATPATPGV